MKTVGLIVAFFCGQMGTSPHWLGLAPQDEIEEAPVWKRCCVENTLLSFTIPGELEKGDVETDDTEDALIRKTLNYSFEGSGYAVLVTVIEGSKELNFDEKFMAIAAKEFIRSLEEIPDSKVQILEKKDHPIDQAASYVVQAKAKYEGEDISFKLRLVANKNMLISVLVIAPEHGGESQSESQQIKEDAERIFSSIRFTKIDEKS